MQCVLVLWKPKSVCLIGMIGISPLLGFMVIPLRLRGGIVSTPTEGQLDKDRRHGTTNKPRIRFAPTIETVYTKSTFSVGLVCDKKNPSSDHLHT